MILDRAADLKTLAELASTKADASNEDASFAVVQEKVDGARKLFISLGVARAKPLQLLQSDQRSEVVRTAKQLHEALGVLADASDTELAAYASGGSDTRGSLLAVSRQASALRSVLLAAQQSLLTSLASEIWPDGDLARLDVISHLSDNPSAAAAGRRIQDVHARLLGRAENDIGLPFDELEELLDQATQASVDAKSLTDESVPQDVIDFWKEASNEGGVGLDALTLEVKEWLDAHQALVLFTVNRDQWP